MAITRGGGIAPLVALLDNGTPAAHGFAAAALARLSTGNTENQVKIAKSLVTLLAPSASEGAQQRAAEQLRQLSVSHQGAAARVVNAGAIAPLITLLGSGPMQARDAAVGVLSYLALSDSSNRLAIATGVPAAPRTPYLPLLTSYFLLDTWHTHVTRGNRAGDAVAPAARAG